MSLWTLSPSSVKALVSFRRCRWLPFSGAHISVGQERPTQDRAKGQNGHDGQRQWGSENLCIDVTSQVLSHLKCGTKHMLPYSQSHERRDRLPYLRETQNGKAGRKMMVDGYKHYSKL